MAASGLGPTESLSGAEARRCALHAQGFGARHRPRGPVRASHLRAVADRLAAVQIDSVNVVTRSHYLPFFSRLGPYDPALLDALRDGPPPGGAGRRHVVEYWAHEASLVPLDVWPLLGFRMRAAQAEAWGSMTHVATAHPDLVASVAAHVAAHGPLTARELDAALAHDVPRRTGHWGWNWSAVKAALEHLFWAGQVSSAGRNAAFERRYAPLEAVLPAAILDRGPAGSRPVPDDEACVALLDRAGRALGVGTEQCLRDYFRLSPARARPALARLVEEGVFRPVAVEGWRRIAYRHVAAVVPARAPRVAALLSPFDSLIWQRDRTRALFGFDYRLEIYTPAAKRKHGYYVLPFLLGDRLVGRVDLKADRAAGVLRVLKTHWEPGVARRPDAGEQLAGQLDALAGFLGLPVVETGPGGPPA